MRAQNPEDTVMGSKGESRKNPKRSGFRADETVARLLANPLAL